MGKEPAKAAGHYLEMRAGDSFSTGQGEELSAQCGSNTAEIKGGKLTVNGKPYGTVVGGTKILIHDGKVFVDGKERSPE